MLLVTEIGGMPMNVLNELFMTFYLLQPPSINISPHWIYYLVFLEKCSYFTMTLVKQLRASFAVLRFVIDVQ